jgi:hypothetical protein
MKKKLPSIPHPKGRAAFGYGRLEITDLVNTYEKDCEFYFQSMEGLAWGGYWTDSPASGNLPFRKRLHGYALRKTLKKGDHLITNCLAFQNIYDQADVVDDLYSHGIYIHFLDLDVGTDTEEGVALIGRLLATIDGSRKRSGIQFLEASAFATLKGRLPGKLPWGYKQRKGKIIWDWARRNQAREYMKRNRKGESNWDIAKAMLPEGSTRTEINNQYTLIRTAVENEMGILAFCQARARQLGVSSPDDVPPPTAYEMVMSSPKRKRLRSVIDILTQQGEAMSE